MSATKPRAAYCTGCGITFPKMYILINHRNTDRCGGRFLPIPERRMVNVLRYEREEQARLKRIKRGGYLGHSDHKEKTECGTLH